MGGLPRGEYHASHGRTVGRTHGNETLHCQRTRFALCRQSADTTDTNANLTNVALKGIIGIQAMAEMSTAMNLSDDAQHYSVSVMCSILFLRLAV